MPALSESIHANPWSRFDVTLGRYYEGAPVGKKGQFKAGVVSAWRMDEGTVRIESAGDTVRANPGEWIVCRPGDRYQEFSDSARIVSLQFNFEHSAGAAWTGPAAATFPKMHALERAFRSLRQTQIIRRLEAQKYVAPQYIPATLEETLVMKEKASSLFRVFLGLMETAGIAYRPVAALDPRVREGIQYMDYGEPFSRASLAARCGVSPSQLDRLWRGELGVTPQQYHNRRRIETACALLQGCDFSLKEIAFKTGFRHPSCFSSWFRAHFRESPRAFRLRHQKM